ncbi:MAG: Gldg family protein [Acidobacteria bacterium]|nr:Gldg family protein [Acidobacteriota bacterium]
MGGTVNTAVIGALARRDLRMYFSSPSGYVFITLFIFLSAAAAFWQDRFFLQNLANLDQLNGVFPYLLLFFIPALTMGVWSEEKKLGTDELLLTLPGTDLEVVLGKYLAVLGIYSASLVLSLSYVGVLFYLGAPDLGLMASNYLGYWFVGAALIAVGMLASLLTRNATVAFIAAGLLCALLVAAGPAASAIAPGLGRALEALGVFLHFDDFAKGIISLSAIVYFVSVGAFFLYLNVLVLSRRHWPRSAGGYPMGLHHAVRGVAVAAALVSAGVLVTNRSIRVDATAEQLHSLSSETRRLLDELPADRPVFIQAFVSPDVPEPFVQTRSNLISILEEIDVIAGPRVEVLIQDTEPFTDAAREARETFGIQPRPVRNVSTARSEVEDVFLGVAFTCGAEEQVIGFFDVGLPAEYELMRSIRVVAGTERKRVGVVATMANLFGGTNFQRNQFTPQWSVVTELRKQYDVVEISPEMAIGQDVDALLVPLPSSLQTDEQGFVADYIRSGKPALILVDPLPAVNPTLSPSEWVGDGNPFTYPPGQPRPGPRGNVREWIRDLGVDWEPTRIVWDAYNPHPELAHMPEDVVFLGAGNENPATFDAGDPMTAQLQELVLLFPGFLEAADDPRFEFQPLLRSGMVSGANGYFSLVRGTPFGPQVNPSPPRRQDDDDYIVAARIRSVGEDAPADVEGAADDAGAEAAEVDEAASETEPGTEAAESPVALAEAVESVAEPESGAEPEPAAEPESGAAAARESDEAAESDATETGGPESTESETDEADGEPGAVAEETPEAAAAPAAEVEAGERLEAEPDGTAPAGTGAEEAESEPAESTEPPAEVSASETAESSASQSAESAASDESRESRSEAVESAETPAEAQEPSAAEAPAAESEEEQAAEPAGAADTAESEEEQTAEPAGAADTAEPVAAAEETDPVAEAAGEPEQAAADESEATDTEPEAADAEQEPDVDAEQEFDAAAESAPEREATGDIDIIVVADLDFISEQFFQIREQAPGGLNFDNITFFLNAMDTLLGEDAFIDLRSRRARHRTLERVEAQTAQFIEQRTADEQQAEADAEEALTEAQQRLNDRVAELQGRADIDAQTRQIMVRNLEEVENRRLEVLSANIETEKDARIQASRENMEAQIRRIQTSIKTFAILLPPVPVVLLGIAIFVRRKRREREGAAAAHRLRE